MRKEKLAINTLRVLSSEMVDKANSGHPGLPLGAAPIAFTLWDRQMKHNPQNPNWINRDRFILSAGHGSALIYSLLHLFRYGLTIEDLKGFRQLNSLTPGHPEYGHTVGVEATTGPLGQGMAMAVGMAMAERHMADTFNTEDYKLIDHYTYTLVGDGCLMEGITNEAASLAGTLGLSKLIVLYDSNDISIEGNTEIAFREDTRKRFEALGFNTFFVEDGNDIEAIEKAIIEAKKSTDKPSFIEIKTKIGYGSPQEGSEKTHGSPLGPEGTKALKEALDWQEKEEFSVPAEVKDYMDGLLDKLNSYEEDWNKLYSDYEKKHPELYQKLQKWLTNDFDFDFLQDKEKYGSFDKALASRAASGKSLNDISKFVDNLFGGSADLAPSNNSEIKGSSFVNKDDFSGKNIHFGVREHAMAAIANGIALHGGLTPFVATFFVFSDYLKPALRLSALMKTKVIYILTHDSIGVGEDGPTHQPIDHASMLRAIPNLVNFRPADNRETAAAWAYAAKSQGHPITLLLSRQGLPDLEGSGQGVEKGAYVLKDFGQDPDLILMSSGSEVKIAYDLAEKLHADGKSVRVVSVPSFELFDAQSEEYKEEVLPNKVRKRVSIEVYNDAGWYKYVGLDGKVINLERFGASAPAKDLYEDLGFTVDKIYKKVLEIL
ncbi:MAG: transketolase [Tissierellia bacterium]|nr:transketolase [Tissierellia bacterium]